MRFAEMDAGVYNCKIADHGITMVDIHGNEVPKAVIAVDIEVGDNNFVRGRWEGFLTKVDGDPNKKTVKTLLDCGFASDSIDDLNNQGSLDMTLELEATVIIGDDGYRRIEWLGLPGSASVKKSDAKAFNSSMRNALKDARATHKPPAKKVLKNHAPKSAMRDDDQDKILF